MIALQTILQRNFKPAFFVGAQYYSTASLLSTLRKKTGFSIANCRKALDLHGNDLDKAEAWLNSQAQANGWEKAVKLQNRAAQNGLVGIMCNGNIGVMLEVNCETDFVSRNQTFKDLVTFCTNSLFSKSVALGTAQKENKINFNSEQLTQLEASDDSKNLADYLAFNIGKIGENIVLRRATALYSGSPIQKVAAGIHPKAADLSSVAVGKYGSLVLIEEKGLQADLPEDLEFQVSDFPRLLCQHVIGMNPRLIKSVEGEGATVADEDVLYKQEFVANPAYTVEELVEKLNCEVQHFIRYECGEQP